MSRWHWSSGPLAALGLLAVSAMAAGWTLYRALDAKQLPVVRASADGAHVAASGQRRVDSSESFAAAIEADPFHPERRRPSVRFRLPGEPVAHPTGQGQLSPQTLPASVIRLIGTIVVPGGTSFVVCQAGAGAPKLLHVGERIEGLTLRRVEQGRAIFVSTSGEKVDLRTARAGA
jgi:hypothetical protein